MPFGMGPAGWAPTHPHTLTLTLVLPIQRGHGTDIGILGDCPDTGRQYPMLGRGRLYPRSRR